MRTAMREIQYAVRRLRGSPMFTIAATLTLAIAIGATASVFSLVDGVLLKAFPYRNPSRVLDIWETNPKMHLAKIGVSVPDYLDLRAQNRAFTALAGSADQEFIVTGRHEPERVAGLLVTPTYFPVLGVVPTLGRGLAPDSSGPDEVVIGYGYWQRRFGGAASVLGQSLRLNDSQYTIVGVMPAGVPGSAELWTRLSFSASDLALRDVHDLRVSGRLRTGVTPEEARSELETIVQRLAAAYPQFIQGFSVLTIPLLDELVENVRPALVALLAAAACVLLIGAANLANLFLVRYLAREREMAVRTALGATRSRLVRELVAEAATLGLVAGALGVGLAIVGVRVLRDLAPPTLPRLAEIGIDGRVVAFCALTSIATVLIFGALPAWQVSRSNLADLVKEGGRATGSAGRHHLQSGLVVLQVAVALVLLTGAGLMVESFEHFERLDSGFRPDGVLTAKIDWPGERYPAPERQASFISSVVDRLAATPGNTAASVSWTAPMSGGWRSAFSVAGDPAPDRNAMPIADVIGITPGYFRTLGIRLLRGRELLLTDDARGVKVAVVDELLARQYFDGRDPIDRHLLFLWGKDTVEIVGVAATVKQRGLAESDMPTAYMPLGQFGDQPAAYIEVRTSGVAGSTPATLRKEIAGVDPTVPVSDVKTLAQRMTESVGLTRFSGFLASLFAFEAILLGVVGIYSVLAFIVSQRRREIAIRIALGATRANVMGEVLRRALTLTGIGIALGSCAAWVLTRALAGLFLGINPHDPRIFVAATATFAVVALVAASVPAFRTTRINPVVALTSI